MPFSSVSPVDEVEGGADDDAKGAVVFGRFESGADVVCGGAVVSGRAQGVDPLLV